MMKILQSPVVQQLILPRPLVAADVPGPAGLLADDTTKKPAAMQDKSSDEGKKMADEEAPLKDVNERPFRPYPIASSRALPGCPLCDASVYSYCDDKVFNDACCCGDINGPYGGGGFGGPGGGFGGGYGGGFGGPGGGFGGPGGGFGGPGGGFGGPIGFGGGFGRSCGYRGCSQLFANSCYEHQLIVQCCCNSPY
ncbi:dnaJ homolog subfamily C member 7 homolog [Anopheles aquasalis]|uniref:dnaJ homolog subfamily C member 7 homolog n=1 Tax=Anopheles aquasalis TaxID=42839 RepID=UPI00215B738E|nr:dnaJ homolog subfamily C member 7 homolog [Anopheles aquasalis]